MAECVCLENRFTGNRDEGSNPSSSVPLPSPSRIPWNSVRRVAVIRRNGFGDLLCTMPLLGYLRSRVPNAHITLFVDRRNAGLCPFLEHHNEVRVFERGNKYLQGFLTCAGTWGTRFDLAISAKPTPMRLINLLLGSLRARQRIAVVEENWHGRLINCPVQAHRAAKGEMHQALEVLRLIEPRLEHVPRQLYPRIAPKCLATFRSPIPASATPTLFTSVSNNRPSCTLDIKTHSHLLNRLHAQRPIRVVISCLPGDVQKAKALEQGLSMETFIAATHDVGTFLQYLHASNMAFLGEGGAMHMAAALDKPQVVLMGNSIIPQWLPLSDKAVWIAHRSHVQQIPEEQIITALSQMLSAL